MMKNKNSKNFAQLLKEVLEKRTKKKGKTMTVEQIKKEIDDHVNGNYADYYIGITNNIERRLAQHNVKNYDLAYKMNSKQYAQEIEEYFLDKGMDGDTGGGNDDSVCVYVYKKTSNSIDSYTDE